MDCVTDEFAAKMYEGEVINKSDKNKYLTYFMFSPV